MRLSIHECSYIDYFSDDRLELLPQVKASGFDAVEYSVLENYNVERALRIKKAMAEAGLITACCTALPGNASFVEGKEQYDAAIEYLKNAVDFCVNVGSDKLSGILYSPWGVKNPDVSKEEKQRKSAEGLKIIADYAKEKGVTLILEVLNRYEGDYINSFDEARQYLKMINRDNVKLIADVYHMSIEEKGIAEVIEKNADLIGNVHISEPNRDFPTYGSIDWKKVTDALKKIGYEGNVTYECQTISGTEVGDCFLTWRDFSTRENFFDRLRTSTAAIKEMLGI